MAGATNKSLKKAGVKPAAIERIRSESGGALTLRSAISAAGPGDIQKRKILRRLPTKPGTYRVHMDALKDVKYTNFVGGRMESIRKGLDAGKKMPPLRMTIDGRGVVDISDGNHRLRVYRERKAKTVDISFDVWRGKGTWAAQQEAKKKKR